jgi:hypothetical protein
MNHVKEKMLSMKAEFERTGQYQFYDFIAYHVDYGCLGFGIYQRKIGYEIKVPVLFTKDIKSASRELMKRGCYD